MNEKKWWSLAGVIVGVFMWLYFLEFREEYADMFLRQKITVYALQVMGLFYGVREILLNENWVPYKSLSDATPTNAEVKNKIKNFIKTFYWEVIRWKTY